MRQIPATLIAISCVLPSPVLAYNSGSISFSIDNDGIVGTDQNYTNGIFLEYHSAPQTVLGSRAPIPIRQIAPFLPLDDNTTKGWSYRLGQQMWTPEDIENPEPVENERPYAGLLFFEAGIVQYSPSRVDKYTAMLGTVGPNAFAEEGQKYIHGIIGSDDPQGWKWQIENQIVFNLGFQGHRLVKRGLSNTFEQYDLSGTGRINIGNYQSELAVGGVARWGSNLGSNFGTTGFTPGQFVDISVLSSSPSGYFLFTGFEGRYRFIDITVEGNRPAEVPDTNIEPLQASFVLGGVYYQPKWGVSLSFASNTREFKEDRYTYSTLGSLELFWRL